MASTKDKSFQGDISRAHDFFNTNFNNNKYKVSTVGPTDTFHVREYVDGSDYLANQQKLVISFQHVPSGRSIFFKAFITAFNETYASDWAEETVYGRPDPILMFKQTGRRITVAWKVPAGSESEAYENLTKIQQLTQFLYATYEDAAQAQTIQQSSLIRLKVMNLAQKNTTDSSDPGAVRSSEIARLKPESIYNNYESSYLSSNGLLGVINSLIVNHNIETDEGVFQKTTNTILPKMMEVNLEFSPIHESSLGWSRDKAGQTTFNTPHFPYNALSHEVTPPPPSLSPESEEFLENLECADTPERCAAALKRLRNQAQTDNTLAKSKQAPWDPSLGRDADLSDLGDWGYGTNDLDKLPGLAAQGRRGMEYWKTMDDIGMSGGRHQWDNSRGYGPTGGEGRWSDQGGRGVRSGDDAGTVEFLDVDE